MKEIKIEFKISLIYYSTFFLLIVFSCNSNELKKVKPSKPKTTKELVKQSEPTDSNLDSSKEVKKYIPPVKPIEIIPIEPGLPYYPTIDPPYDPDPPIELPESELIKDSIVQFPDYDAQFPGGSQAQKEFIRKNLKFPRIMEQMDFEGWVLVKFLVHSTGEISQIQIERGLHEELDFEAINVIKKMPLWNPAVFQNRKVPTYVFTSVWFTIER